MVIFSDLTLSGVIVSNFFAVLFALVFLSIVALTTRGKKNRPSTIVWGVAAGLGGFLLGKALTSVWIDFDELYVSIFSRAIIDQSVDFTSGFTVVAILVVSMMILFMVSMAINFFSDIGTDDTGFDGLAK